MATSIRSTLPLPEQELTLPRSRKTNRFTASSWDQPRANGAQDVFAAAPIDMATPGGRKYARSVVKVSKDRHENSWKWLDRIGEVHYAIHRGAKVAGYAKLYAHKLNPDGTIGERIKSGGAADFVAAIQSPTGGVRGLVERFFLMMKVPGDTYLIRTRDSEGNATGYDFLSASELDLSGAGSPGETERVVPNGTINKPIRRITLPNSSEGVLGYEIKPEDFLGRVWRPAGRYLEMPDSPMRALDLECELLHTLTLGMRAKLLNRLTLNGVMILDKSVTTARSAAPSPEPGQFHQNPVLNDFINAMVYAVTEPDDPQAAMPILLQTSGAVAPKDVLEIVTTDRTIDQTDMELRKELIDRIIMGLDVQPQHVRGMGESNHWSAWAVSDDERRVSIQPDIEVMCWALTRLVLNPALNAMGRTRGVENTVIWYDLTDANVKTNLAEDSRQMRDRMLIGEEPARRMSGLAETDAPDDADLVRMVGQATGNPYLALFGLPVWDEIDWDKVAEFMGKKPGPQQDSAADPSETSPSKGAPDKPKGTATPIRKAS